MHNIDMKITKYALLIVAVITTFYLLLLGWFNTLTADDFGFVYRVESLGLWGFIKHAYMTWQCRFSSYFLVGILYEIFGRCSNLVGYTAVLLLMGYATFFWLLKDIIPQLSNKKAILFAVVINNLSIMSFFDMGTFYWLCTPDYFVIIYATIILFDMVFISKMKILYRWIVVLLCAIYLCGNFELYLAILIFFFGIGLFIWFVKNPKNQLLKDYRFQMLLTTLIIMGVGFIIQYIGPGTQIRMSSWQSEPDKIDFMHNFAFVPFIKASLKALIMLALRVLFQLHFYILFFGIMVFVGYAYKEKFLCDKALLKKRISYILACFLIIYVVSVEISVFSLSCLAPIRSYTFIHYALLICLGYIGLLVGANYLSSSIVRKSLSVCSVVIVCITAAFIIVEYPKVKQYKSDVTQTLAFIQNTAKEKPDEDIIVQPVRVQYVPSAYWYCRNLAKKKLSDNGAIDDELPGSFPYLPFELSTIPTDFKNNGLRQYLGIENDIIGWVAPKY